MKKYLQIPVFTATITSCVAAQAIDLQCEQLATQMVERLATEGLLLNEHNAVQRARDIALSSCASAENSAQEQLEESKKDWAQNWLFEQTGGKPGNKRLKNFKR